MARPRADGAPPKEPDRREFTERYLNGLKPAAQPFTVRDTKQLGLAVIVHPSGTKTFKLTYSFHGRPRWFSIGKVGAINLPNAREIAAETMLKVLKGEDPHAARMAHRGAGTFADLAKKYVDQYARKHNKSWKQADALVRNYLLPKWGKLLASNVTRDDVKQIMSQIERPILANQVLASASAIFSWAVKEGIVPVNPCSKIDRNPTSERERILSDSEIPKIWPLLSPALKVLLLTGQRPGEVAHMHRSHFVDGFWQMPGKPVAELGWPGTKNKKSHRVWLAEPVLDILAGLPQEGRVFRGNRIDNAMRATMRSVCDGVTPHDLRRTFSSKVAELFSVDHMHRVTNHAIGGRQAALTRSDYSKKNKDVMETVARAFMDLIEKPKESNVVPIKPIPA